MNMLNITNKILILAGLTGLVLTPAVVQADTFVREIEEVFDTQPNQLLRIKVGVGDIEVVPVDSEKVVLQILMSTEASSEDKANDIFDTVMVEFSEDSDEIFLHTGLAKKESRSWFGLKRPVLPKIKVIAISPENMDLELATKTGNISLKGIAGELILDTGTGNIVGSGLAGYVYADTGAGNVILADLEGDLDADTGAGNIDAKGMISRFDADTGAGNISIQSSIQILEDSLADTGSGNITVKLPASSSFKLEASVGIGSAKCDFDGFNTEESGSRKVYGSAGSDGPFIELDAGVGNILLKGIN